MAGRALMRRALLLSTMLVPATAWAGSPALPTQGQVVSGGATIARSGGTLTIDQTTQQAIIDWRGFDIGRGGAVTIDLPDPTAIELDRVISGAPADILGTLRSNGRIVLVDPGGFLFGSGAVVDTGALAVSSLGISDADFLAGDLRFSRAGAAGAIVNEGTIRAAAGGSVALLAPEIRNAGLVEARLGTVALASGDAARLDVSGRGLVGIAVKPATVKSAIDAGGVVSAAGGKVLMTAQAANALYGGAINAHGIVEADSLTGAGGAVTLDASGTLDLAGSRISATGATKGGAVETSGGTVALAAASVATGAKAGKAGTWTIDPVNLTVGVGAAATIDKALQTGNVTLKTTATAASGAGTTSSGPGDIVVDAALAWSGSTILTLDAYHGVTIDAGVTASGAKSGLAIVTDDGGTGGRLTIADPVTLSGSAATLAVDGHAYTLIRTAAELRSLGTTGYFALDGDIDLGGAAFTPIGYVASGQNQVPHPFMGTFEGLGHGVSGLLVDASGAWNLGLFSAIGGTGRVENLTVSGTIDMTGGVALDAGLLAGRSAGSIYDVAVSGKVTAGTNDGYAGGLVGLNQGTVDAARSSGALTGGDGVEDLGGLVGFNTGALGDSQSAAKVTGMTGAAALGGLVGGNGGALTGSAASGSVTAGAGGSSIGGLVGDNAGSVKGSHASGAVVGIGDSEAIGGLVGDNQAVVSGGAATGAVEGGVESTEIGGLVGFNTGSITGSRASGSVTGLAEATSVGGLAGQNNPNATIASSSATGRVTGGVADQGVGGLVGLNDGSIVGGRASGNVVAYAQAVDVGGVAGQNLDVGTIEGSTAAGAVSLAAGEGGGNVGGLVGANLGAIASSVATGAVMAGAGTAQIGGLVGENDATIELSHATGSVRAGDLTRGVGGLIGGNDRTGVIGASYATGAVTGGVASGYLGGFVGENSGMIAESYATGAVAVGASSETLGGFAGDNLGAIRSSYAIGPVAGAADGTLVGGFAGSNEGNIDQVYATGAVSGGGTLGALLGRNAGSLTAGYATGGATSGTSSLTLVGQDTGKESESAVLSVDQSREQSSYVGFDFSKTWTIDNGVSPPKLDWQ